VNGVSRKKITFLYSGQGSQYYQAGRDLFAQHGAFQRIAREIDELIQAVGGVSVLDTIYDPRRKPSEPLDRTSLSHPAIFLVEYALSQALIADGVQPDYVMTVSMGAFAALAVAGSMTVEQAVSAVVAQGRLVEQYCEPGGMLALPVAGEHSAALFAAQHGCELATDGRRTASVVAGRLAQIGAAESALRQIRRPYQRLPVSRAFHSRWLDPARASCMAFLQQVHLAPPRIPVVCGASAQILESIPASYLWDVIREPIRFEQAAQRLCSLESIRFVDVGPSGTLATSLKYCAPHFAIAPEIETVLTPFGGGFVKYQRVVSRSAS
jgi:acyl transferase domain-containing protein